GAALQLQAHLVRVRDGRAPGRGRRLLRGLLALEVVVPGPELGGFGGGEDAGRAGLAAVGGGDRLQLRGEGQVLLAPGEAADALVADGHAQPPLFRHTITARAAISTAARARPPARPAPAPGSPTARGPARSGAGRRPARLPWGSASRGPGGACGGGSVPAA